jgi:predicted DNA-binding mobile mystery protein A
MKKIFKKMMREQIQDDLNNLDSLVKNPRPKEGWIEIIRKALGMSGLQLAKRMGSSQANIATLERREKTGNITLETLEKAADAMNFRCVYFFIPNKPIDQILEDQARLVAKKQLRSVEHSMELEHQGLSPEQKKRQEDDLVQELLQGSLRDLWDY